MNEEFQRASASPRFTGKIEVGNFPLWLPFAALSMGLRIGAGRGSGKSRLLGRIIAWIYFLAGMPQVIFDPHGPTIDNFLDKILRLPKEVQEQAWKRIRYIDISGKMGAICPFPLYYRLGDESLYEVSQRFLDAIRKIDPFLQTASIEGWNPLWRTGTFTGMLLAALDLQITEAEHLLRFPWAWLERMAQALARYPELAPAVAFFSDLADERMPESLRNRWTGSFLNKIAMFTLEPSMQAMFGARTAGIDWGEVVDKRITVLLDFRYEQDIERRRFKMMWIFQHLLSFIKHRGAGRHTPLGLMIDELAALFSLQALAGDFLAGDLDELINILARNYSINLSLAHQELFQFSERMQKTLLSMGTQIMGISSDTDATLRQAQQFYDLDPYWVKKIQRVWMSDHGSAFVVDHTTTEFTPEEQFLLHAQAFQDLGRFQFLVRPAMKEGDMTGKLQAVSIANYDRGQYPDVMLLAQVRQKLARLDGQPTAALLPEIQGRLVPSYLQNSPPHSPSPEGASSEPPAFWTE